MLSREARKKLRKLSEEIAYEDRKKKELLNAGIDYNFLQSLMDKATANPDLAITIYFKSGDRMVIQTKYKESAAPYSMNGNPTELEIR